MLRYLIVILILIFLTNGAYSSACKSITKFKEFEKSEIVILGYIVEKNEGHYIINVMEVFKGDDTILGSKISGSLGEGLINPDIGETWLLYGSFSEKELIVSTCGHSRSFNRPYSIGGNNSPPPPSPNETSEEAQQLITNIYLNRALAELRYDILELRYKKLQKELAEFKNKNRNRINYPMWFLFGLSLLFFGFGVYYVWKKKTFLTLA